MKGKYRPLFGPDGDSGLMQAHGVEYGIAGFNAPIDSLVAVFLDFSQPDLTPPPTDFMYQPAATTVSPELKQLFFVGDGLTGTGSGTVQQFIVSAGATRLFLGTVDGYGWYNNVGSFDVVVVPEPSSLALAAVALAALALQARKRARPVKPVN
jgi:hypothetical protein